MREAAWPPLVEESGLTRQLEAFLASPLHAYLFLGPDGIGKHEVARVFAAELMASAADGASAPRHRQSVLEGTHPDFVEVRPRGRSLLDEQASLIVVEASRKPSVGARKVILVDRFHTAHPTVAPKILKTLEEPPESVVIVLLAAFVRPDHVTVASRCVKALFKPSRSIASGESAARASAGELRRAYDLMINEWSLTSALDPSGDEHYPAGEGLSRRNDFWGSLPRRFSSSGADAAVMVDEALGVIAASEASARKFAESTRKAEGIVDASAESSTERSQRRARLSRALHDAELRFGLAVLLNHYSAMLTGPAASQASKAIDLLNAAAKALVFNPNEKLLLQNLFLQLPPLQR